MISLGHLVQKKRTSLCHFKKLCEIAKTLYSGIRVIRDKNGNSKSRSSSSRYLFMICTYIFSQFKLMHCKRFSKNYNTETVVWNSSTKEVFLKISQNSQEITCTKVSFFNKVPGLFHFFFI